MTEIDALLEGLRDTAPDPRLAGMEDAVLAGLTERRAHGAARRALAMTGVLALGVGLAGSLFSTPEPVRAERQLALGTIPAGAPSTLLLGMR